MVNADGADQLGARRFRRTANEGTERDGNKSRPDKKGGSGTLGQEEVLHESGRKRRKVMTGRHGSHGAVQYRGKKRIQGLEHERFWY